jgi:hypothetical protein
MEGSPSTRPAVSTIGPPSGSVDGGGPTQPTLHSRVAGSSAMQDVPTRCPKLPVVSPIPVLSLRHQHPRKRNDVARQMTSPGATTHHRLRARWGTTKPRDPSSPAENADATAELSSSPVPCHAIWMPCSDFGQGFAPAINPPSSHHPISPDAVDMAVWIPDRSQHSPAGLPTLANGCAPCRHRAKCLQYLATPSYKGVRGRQ